MTHAALSLGLVVVALAACTSAPLAPVAPPDASHARDASLADDAVFADAVVEDAAAVDATARDAGLAHDGAPPDATSLDRCRAGAIEGCAYHPGVDYERRPPVTLSLSYDDASGAERTFEIAVHRPEGAPSPSPVVVWSHGGADGIARASAVADEWARAFTSAGYVFIAIAHIGRDNPSRSALCAAIGVADAGCATFKYLSWDRPHDLDRVLDWLEDPGSVAAGSVDLTRIAYAGHSAGAGGAMVVAGAGREIGGTLRFIADERPRAFIACSPQGPGDDGFVDASFDAISRPTLTLSGVGDDTDVVAENRRVPFERMMSGDKYLGWITDESARHTTFDLELGGCERYAADTALDPARCTMFRPWLLSAALAFLDAELREDAIARDYLASDALEILSSGVMEWTAR